MLVGRRLHGVDGSALMLALPTSVRIYLATAHTDMRKGFDGLAALVEAQGLDLYSGHLFVFLSRRRNRVKILTWDRGGFVLYYKRLEQSRFQRPVVDAKTGHIGLDAAELTMLLDGVDLARVQRSRVWNPPNQAS